MPNLIHVIGGQDSYSFFPLKYRLPQQQFNMLKTLILLRLTFSQKALCAFVIVDKRVYMYVYFYCCLAVSLVY